MDANSFKTYSARSGELQQDWYIVDAENLVVGRVATRVASVLRGKHKPTYTPHTDTGDFVVIINADKVRFTGSKERDKEYTRFTGYPGGLRLSTPRSVRAKNPEFILQHAIKGMLPKGPLGRKMIRKLKVYAGTDHPHTAQQPRELTI